MTFEEEVDREGIVWALSRLRRPGESLFATARRELMLDAMRQTRGRQVGAAKLLFEPPRVIQWIAKDLRMRPKDRSL